MYLYNLCIIFQRINQSTIEFVEMLAIMSALKVGKADNVFIHTNTDLHGEYWNMIKNESRLVMQCVNNAVCFYIALRMCICMFIKVNIIDIDDKIKWVIKYINPFAFSVCVNSPLLYMIIYNIVLSVALLIKRRSGSDHYDRC